MPTAAADVWKTGSDQRTVNVVLMTHNGTIAKAITSD
jgi:hypothetical protein